MLITNQQNRHPHSFNAEFAIVKKVKASTGNQLNFHQGFWGCSDVNESVVYNL